MLNKFLPALIFCLLLFANPLVLTAEPLAATQSPEALIAAVIEANGGSAAFAAKRDVTYSYLYRKADGQTDLSIEKYILADETSYGRYLLYENKQNLLPHGKQFRSLDTAGKTEVWQDGQQVNDSALQERADFSRKTNFYWFAMMFKLADPGTHYKFKGVYEQNGISYHAIELSFAADVGDVQDKYLLFINPETLLVDFFLFTVMDFDMTEPLLMEVSYQKVDGILVPAYRRYTKAVSWEKPVPLNNKGAVEWTEEISLDFQFDQNLTVRGLQKEVRARSKK